MMQSQTEVGGDTNFTMTRDTLTAARGSRLAQLFSGRWDERLRRDAEGRVFLDFHPLQFRKMQRLLRDAKRTGPGSKPSEPADYEKALPEWCRPGFVPLCNFLCSPNTCKFPAPRVDGAPELRDMAPAASSSAKKEKIFDSVLLGAEQAELLESWVPPVSNGLAGSSFELLFRASRDGWTAQAFHQKCDGKGPTVVVAKSQGGHLFGGYTEVPWDSSGQYKSCQQSFLFRLASPDNSTQPSKHQIFQTHQYGIYCDASYGPTFGGNHDLCIQQSGSSAVVNCNIGHTYNPNSSAPAGGSFSYLAEAQSNVALTDYEVFVVKADSRASLESTLRVLKSLSTLASSQPDAREEQLLQTALRACIDTCEYGQSLLQVKRDLEHSQDTFEQEAQFLQRFFGNDKDIVHLNVGGKRMATLLSTLTFCEGSYLATKFGGTWTLQEAEMVEGGVWFDEDPDLFEAVLMHIRVGSLLGESFAPKPDEKKSWDRLVDDLMLVDYFKRVASADSELLGASVDDLMTFLPEPGAGKKIALELLFRASRDGWTAQAFHQKCDGKGPTVVVAKSQGGHLFGGYTEVPWDSSGQYKSCQQSFLFRLAGPDSSTQPSKHQIFQNHQNGIHCHASYGPTFGGNHDLQIQPSGSSGVVNVNIGQTYNPNSSAPAGGHFTCLAEQSGAALTDYEVFAVSSCD